MSSKSNKRIRNGPEVLTSLEPENNDSEEYTAELEDLSRKRSEGTEKASKVAVEKFNAYLRAQKICDTWEDLIAEDLTPELMGRFSSYLVVEEKLAHSTTKSTLSHVKTQLADKFPFYCQGPWYNKLRRTVGSEYNNKVVASGNDERKGISISAEHFHQLCEDLYSMKKPNVIDALITRALFSVNWTCLGRITEVTSLKWDNVEYGSSRNVTSMRVTLNRKKTGKKQVVMVFLHYKDWFVCPFHALATMIVCCRKTCLEMFPLFSKDNAVQEVNNKLKELYRNGEGRHSDWKQYTSHGMRHGATEAANEDPNIKLEWIVKRGGWQCEHVRTIFNYLEGTQKEDAAVGRSLGDWPKPNEGGMCPSKCEGFDPQS